jgi:hypothetical protein
MTFDVKLSADLGLKWTVDDDMATANPFTTWVGFKDSFDCLEKYEILANGISKYTQSYPIEESFLTNCCAPDALKKADLYSKARHKDVWSGKYGDKCGKYVKWVKGQLQQTVNLKIKIDIRRFLILSNIRYLPAFAGKIELKLMFGTNGLVVAPMDPKVIFKGNLKRLAAFEIPEVTNYFVQIGEEIMMIAEHTEKEETVSGSNPEKKIQHLQSLIADERTVSVGDRSLKIHRCESTIYCFGLVQNLYDQLVQRYTSMTLTYPTQVLSFSPMSGLLKQANSKSSQTITPRFVDTIFLLFPHKPTDHSCFWNPEFENFYLTCGGYGQYPDIPFGTKEEPRFVELCSNAMNLNSNTSGLPEEVLRSSYERNFNVGGLTSRDSSNFFIGIPVETDNTFQQGQTSATPITYELHVTQGTSDTKGYAQNVEAVPLLALLQDATFSIQIMPDGSPSLVEIGAFDITSPING